MRSLFLSFAFAVSFSAVTAQATEPAKKAAPAPAATCEHGVSKAICTRCNPKLEAVFKSTGDWCPEHARPESQCAICNADVAEKGVKK